MNKIEELERKIKENNEIISKFRNENYELTEELNKLLIEENKTNIGRCYLKGDYYFKIIGVDDLQRHMYGPSSFNEYVYKAYKFKYPYNDSLLPYVKTEINLCPANIKEYKEISEKEFNEKFMEVNMLWIRKQYISY